MPGSAISTFSEPDDFAAALCDGGSLDLLVIDRGPFRARLTRIALHRLCISSAEEHLSRIAFISLQPGIVRVSMPMKQNAPLVCGGIRVHSGEILTQRSDARVHERLDGPCHWRDVRVPINVLASYGEAVIGTRFQVPSGLRVWRPPAGAFKRLTDLHVAAIRQTEIRPGASIEAEAAHGIEQELIHALIDCLSAGPADDNARTRRRHASIMARFDDTLRAHPNRVMSLDEICEAVRASERNLRTCCAAHLGMGPCRYLRLRRLQLTYRALGNANPHGSSVSWVARHYGFTDLSRFAAGYRAMFGELPSATLRRR